MLLGYKEKTRLNSASKNTLPAPQFQSMASTSRMRTAISPEQWPPWTAVSPLFMIIRLHQHTAELVVCAYCLFLVLYEKSL